MKFPIVELPEYYSGLLKLNISSIDKALAIIPAYVLEHQHLKFLVKKYFKDINSQGHVAPILKSLGWVNFRDRLCSLFIYRQANGVYPEIVNSDISKGINLFEQKILSYSVNGFNRGYLFGFYLKMARIYTNSSQDYNFLNIEQEILELLALSKVRIIQIDWLLIMILHFSHFLGIEVLRDELKKETKFRVLYKSLSLEEKDLMVENMLAYGASIDEPDAFSGKMV